jgi:hypothetical protein
MKPLVIAKCKHCGSNLELIIIHPEREDECWREGRWVCSAECDHSKRVHTPDMGILDTETHSR